MLTHLDRELIQNIGERIYKCVTYDIYYIPYVHYGYIIHIICHIQMYMKRNSLHLEFYYFVITVSLLSRE